MKYTVQPGLLLRDIAGMHIIIATGEAQEVCPPMKQFNDAGAFYWSLLEQGLDEEAILDACADHFQAEREDIRAGFHRFMEKLAANAYITVFDKEAPHDGSGL